MSDEEDTKAVVREEAVQSISIKSPDFTEASPALFFKLLEAQFHLRGIKLSKTRFFHALSSLPSHVLENIPLADLENENYEDLKKQIIHSYEKTKPELFEKLMSNQVMTGRPSAYLRQLQQLAAKVGVNDDLVRHKFLQNLPPSIAPVVAASPSSTLAHLGNVADESMSLYNSILSKNDSKYSNVQNINRNVNTKTTNLSVAPFHPDQRPKICRYHIFYAERARKCKPWCRYPNKKDCTMEPSSRAASPARPKQSQEN